MKALSPDTSDSAEETLVRMLRQAPVYRHLEIVASLVRTTRRLSWQGICERHPDEPPRALARRFFFLLYPEFSRAKRIDEIFEPGGRATR